MSRNFVLAYGDLDPNRLIADDVDVVIMEADPLRNGNPNAGLTASELAAVKAAGVEVVGYVDVAATDHYRPYWNASWTVTGDDTGQPIAGVAPSWLVNGIQYDYSGDGITDAYIVDYGDPAWRNIVFAQIQDLIARGFSGVFLDDFGSYFTNHAGRTPSQNAAVMIDFLVQIRTLVGPNFKIYANGNPFIGVDAGLNAVLNQNIDGMILEVYSLLTPAQQETFLNAAATNISSSVELVTVDRIENPSVYFDYLLKIEARGYASTASVGDYGAQDLIVTAATSGDDVIFGSMNGNAINGGNGNDKIAGRAGIDVIYGDAGNDILLGGNEADKLFGGTGLDQLFGGAGNDILEGAGDHDVLDGQSNDDKINGGKGNDQLIGGDGQDILLGAGGNDTLTGGAGSDQFVFGKRFGNDIVTDFQQGVDKLLLDDLLWLEVWSLNLTNQQLVDRFGSLSGNVFTLNFGSDEVISFNVQPGFNPATLGLDIVVT
jgi:uncharacterized protein (TIGR01370 family)